MKSGSWYQVRSYANLALTHCRKFTHATFSSVGWSASSSRNQVYGGAFGQQEESVKARMIHLISAVRMLLRGKEECLTLLHISLFYIPANPLILLPVPLIAVNTLVIVYLIVF